MWEWRSSSRIPRVAGFFNVFVPVNVGAHFRLEPQVGWRASSFEQVSSDPTAPASNVSGSSRVLLVGLGALATHRPAGRSTILYYGPRVGLAWTRNKLADPSAGSLTETQTSWYLTAVVGGEHLFSHLSIGGEAGLGYLHFGTPKWTLTGAGFTASDAKGHSLGTNATALVRWYFGR